MENNNNDKQFESFLDILLSESMDSEISDRNKQELKKKMMEQIKKVKPGNEKAPSPLLKRVLQRYDSLYPDEQGPGNIIRLQDMWKNPAYMRLTGHGEREKYNLKEGFDFYVEKYNLTGIVYVDEEKVRIQFTLIDKTRLLEYTGKHIVVLYTIDKTVKKFSEPINEKGDIIITLEGITADTFNPAHMKFSIIPEST